MRIYSTEDFDRMLVLDDGTQLVARKISEFLDEGGGCDQKVIIFCVDQEHAACMRQGLINENADPDVWSRHLMVHCFLGNGSMRYWTGSSRLCHDEPKSP